MGCERIRPKSVLMENSHSASTLKFHQPSPFKRRRGENKTKQKIPWVLQVFLDHQVLIFPLPGSGSYLPILFFTCYHILFARFTLKTIITPGPPFPERIRNNQELQKLHFTGKVKLLETLSFQENKSVSNSLWAAGRGWEGGESPPIGLTGLITQTKPVLTIGYQEGYSQGCSQQPSLGLGQLPRIHSERMLGEKATGRGPASSFLVTEWQAAGWTHAWQMAFQRDFGSHLGWVQLLQTVPLTKPEGLLPERREVKQILSY